MSPEARKQGEQEGEMKYTPATEHETIPERAQKARRYKRERDELLGALEQIQNILGITETFVPLGPALECAPIIRAVLEKVKK